MTHVRFPLALTIACALFACTGSETTELSENPSDTAAQDEPRRPAGPSAALDDRLVTVGEFRGFADPVTGELVIETILPEGVESMDELRTRRQGLWCEALVDQDGTPGSGSVNTVELVTPPGSVFAGLAGDTPNITACRTGDDTGAGPNANNPEGFGVGSRTSLYDSLGVFCGDVTVRSFYSGTLLDTYAEITETTAETSQYAYQCEPGACDGTGAWSVTEGSARPDNGLGLWSYGALNSGGADNVQWAFRLGTSADFQFRGRIVSRIEEECYGGGAGNGDDDDCDGIVDNSCRLFPPGSACVDDLDCVPGYACVGNLCDLPTYVWTGGGGDSLWDTPSNWSPVGVPANGDVAVFNATNVDDATAEFVVGFDGPALRLEAGYTGTVTMGDGPLNGDVSVFDGTLRTSANGDPTILGNLEVGPGGTLGVQTGGGPSWNVSGTAVIDGTIDGQGGSIAFHDDVTLNSELNAPNMFLVLMDACDFEANGNDVTVSVFAMSESSTLTGPGVLNASSVAVTDGAVLNTQTADINTTSGGISTSLSAVIDTDGGSITLGGDAQISDGSQVLTRGGSFDAVGGGLEVFGTAILDTNGGGISIGGEVEIGDGGRVISGNGDMNVAGDVNMSSSGFLDTGVGELTADEVVLIGGATFDVGAMALTGDFVASDSAVVDWGDGLARMDGGTISDGARLTASSDESKFSGGLSIAPTATFIHNGGEVTLENGSPNLLSADGHTFFDLKTSTDGETYLFGANETFAVANLWSAIGSPGGEITLGRFGGSGLDQWGIDVQSSFFVDHVLVSNSNNVGVNIDPATWSDDGNNTNWGATGTQGLGEACIVAGDCYSGFCGAGFTCECPVGFVDCDGLDPNGCEIESDNDLFNCGGCGMDCTALANVSTTICSAGVCVIGACDPGFDDNDTIPSNGCEECTSDRWGPECHPCPGGVGNPCDANGTCSVGVSGTGVCTCDPTFFGLDCADTCGDGVRNHMEWRVDCGPACSTGCPAPSAFQVTAPFSGGQFGYWVSLSDDVALIGDDTVDGHGRAYIYRLNGSNWELEQELSPIHVRSRFSDGIAVDGDVAVVGDSVREKVTVWRYDGSTWNQEVDLDCPASACGSNVWGSRVDVSGDVFVVGAYHVGDIYVYRYNGSSWIEEQIIDLANPYGDGISISGDALVVADHGTGVASFYRFNGTSWVVDDTDSPGDFGHGHRGIDVDGDIAVIGNPQDDIATIYRFDGSDWVEQQTVAPISGTGDSFGWSVATSGDWVAVGSRDDDAPLNSGSVHVFRHESGTWIPYLYLRAPTPSSGARYAESIALYGSTLLVGERGTDEAYFYDLSLYPAEQKLTPAGLLAGDEMGESSAIWGDFAAFGAPFDATLGADAGAVHLYRMNNTADWLDEGLLTAPALGAGAELGVSADIHGDVIVAGAPQSSALVSGGGGAVIARYIQYGTGFTTESTLFPSDPEVDHMFGEDVAVFGDLVVVGAPGDTTNGFEAGAAYVFRHQVNGTWIEDEKLVAPDGAAFDRFGARVAAYGDLVAVGAPNDSSTAAGAGQVYVFRMTTGGNWSLEDTIELDSVSGVEAFGEGLDVFGDTIAVGAPFDTDFGGPASGSVTIFHDDGTGQWLSTGFFGASDAEIGAEFGSSVSLSSRTLVVGAPFHDGRGPNSGKVYQLRYNGTSWVEQRDFVGTDTDSNDAFGQSVHVSGANMVIGAPFDDQVGQDGGSAYVYGLTR